MRNRGDDAGMQNVLELSPDAHVVYERLAYVKGKRTVEEFVIGVESAHGDRNSSLDWPASRVRRALGELYGFGMVKVESIVDGYEAWTRVMGKDLLTR